MKIKHAPLAKAEMLIRKPVAEVFEAFVDPAITSKFWFTKSSGRLESGKQIRWDWEMYDHSAREGDEIVKAGDRLNGRIYVSARWLKSAKYRACPAAQRSGRGR